VLRTPLSPEISFTDDPEYLVVLPSGFAKLQKPSESSQEEQTDPPAAPKKGPKKGTAEA
jgi:hypothetical protein